MRRSWHVYGFGFRCGTSERLVSSFLKATPQKVAPKQSKRTSSKEAASKQAVSTWAAPQKATPPQVATKRTASKEAASNQRASRKAASKQVVSKKAKCPRWQLPRGLPLRGQLPRRPPPNRQTGSLAEGIVRACFFKVYGHACSLGPEPHQDQGCTRSFVQALCWHAVQLCAAIVGARGHEGRPQTKHFNGRALINGRSRWPACGFVTIAISNQASLECTVQRQEGAVRTIGRAGRAGRAGGPARGRRVGRARVRAGRGPVSAQWLSGPPRQ